ncbi:hypothetical protein ACP4OV_006380 [Aristida adscensionis]
MLPGSGDPNPELPGALKCGVPQRPCSPPPPPPPSSSHGRSTFVTALIIAGAVLAVLALCLSLYLFLRLRRRRQRQRQQQQEALLEAALAQAPPAAAPAAFPAGGGPGPGEEEVVHHVWHIRTVGLDEAAIESIALTRYRAGPGGVLGAADCAVCLGEFRDGELLRLLPKCGHAFHVPCIDTWLRAHVNCPLCRADVLGPAAADEQPGDPPAGADADADADRPGLEQPHQHGNERHELRVQIDQRAQSSSPERPHRLHGARAHSFRRVASMDSPSSVASAEEAPEVELSISENEKQGAGGAVRREGATGSSRLDLPAMERSLSVGSRWALLSRHCRTRSSLMPL